MVAARSPRTMTAAWCSADKAALVLWSARTSVIATAPVAHGRTGPSGVSNASDRLSAMATFVGAAPGPASVRGGRDAGARPAPGDPGLERRDGDLARPHGPGPAGRI